MLQCYLKVKLKPVLICILYKPYINKIFCIFNIFQNYLKKIKGKNLYFLAYDFNFIVKLFSQKNISLFCNLF